MQRDRQALPFYALFIVFPMRNNQPVTQQEYLFPATQTLVSVTDRQGCITYCNPAFVTVSGYTEEELIGQPLTVTKAGLQ